MGNRDSVAPSAPSAALGKMRVMENMPDLERVREQYIDAETGQLVWAYNDTSAERLAAGELVPLPEPAGVVGDHFVMPYTPRITVASLETAPPPFTGLREAHLRKRTLVAGPYLIRVWEKA